jgi:poly(A) polymerase
MPSAPDLQLLTSNLAARRIMDIARAGNGEARIVGGAVRDALLGNTAKEIDFATTLPPETMVALLAKAGIKTVPTGIEHGTITAVIDGCGYEITTLRHDIKTDGRRAKVAFTDDWQADAARRDFTMNALYLDTDGKLYDYFDGQKDLTARHIRFIGNPAERIREDVLRILRFFRFYAWFGKDQIDADGLKACRELANLIPQLSVERIWREITKLLSTPNPAPAWRLMLDAKILKEILPEAANSTRLESLLATEIRYEIPADPLRRFAATLSSASPTLTQRLKLSKRETAKLQNLTTLPALLNGKLDPVPFRHALYEHGAENTRNAALLYAASHPGTDLEPALSAAANWENPVFPLQGEDLRKFGLKPGPAMGTLLRQLEEEWIAADFKPTRTECLALAKKKLSTE